MRIAKKAKGFNKQSHEKWEKLYKLKKRLVHILFVSGIALIVWVVWVFEKYIIMNPVVPILITIFTGVCFASKARTYLHTLLESDYGYWAGLIFSTVLFGSLSCAMIVLPNYYLAEANSFALKYRIVKKETTSLGKGSDKTLVPYISIDCGGYTKSITFTEHDLEKVKDANYIRFELKNGLYKVPVIVSAELVP